MTDPITTREAGYPAMRNPLAVCARGRVERVQGEHDVQPHRRWVTYRTYLDGQLLGNAVDEAEGWRWIDDMLEMEARDA